MTTIMHRVTKELKDVTDLTGYPSTDWLYNPDLSGVVGWRSDYWKIVNEAVELMTQAERDAVGESYKQEEYNYAIDHQFDGVDQVLRAFAQVVVDEINILRQQHSLPDRTLAQLKTAIRNKIGS